MLAELEEGQHAKSDPQMKGAAPAEGQKKLDKKTPGGEVEDGGAAVVDPEAKSSPTDVAAKGAAEIGGDAQQKGEKPAEPMKKIKKVSEEEDHESDEDSEVIEEAAMPRTKMGMLKAMYSEMEKMKAKDLKANYGKIMSAMHPEGAHEDDEDEDMQEAGEDYAAIIQLPFKLVETSMDD